MHLRNVQRTYMMELSAEVLEEVREVLRPLAEAWSGVLLEHTSTYGVRRYTNNSWLVAHLDRFLINSTDLLIFWVFELANRTKALIRLIEPRKTA